METNVVSAAYRHPIRVYYEDTDAAGIVYYANYFKFAERARTEILRQQGIQQEALRAATGSSFVVRRCTADFMRAAKLDDNLVIITRITAISGATVEFEQEVECSGDILVRLTVQIACIGRDGRAQRLPAEFRAAFYA